MELSNAVFDDDISNVINTLRVSLHTFKNLEVSNSVLKQKNKLLNEELQSTKKTDSSGNQDEILKGISDNLQKNSAILDERMANLQAELKVALQLNRKYKNDIDRMEEKYINEIQTLKEYYTSEIKRLKSEFENKIETMNFNSVLANEEHTMKIDEINAQSSTKIMELKLEHVDIVDEYERGIGKLNDKIAEITTNYDKLKEKCANLEKKLSESRENNTKAKWSPNNDDVFANKPNHPKPIDKPSKSNIQPSFATKITKANDELNKPAEVVTEKPKKRKLFNPRSEIMFLKYDE